MSSRRRSLTSKYKIRSNSSLYGSNFRGIASKMLKISTKILMKIYNLKTTKPYNLITL